VAHPMGEAKHVPLRVDFDRRLKLEFHGSQISSDGGLLPYRESAMAAATACTLSGPNRALASTKSACASAIGSGSGGRPWGYCLLANSILPPTRGLEGSRSTLRRSRAMRINLRFPRFGARASISATIASARLKSGHMPVEKQRRSTAPTMNYP
jgi:hypothetical protein